MRTLALLAAGLLLAGCGTAPESGTTADPPSPRTSHSAAVPPAYPRYVALGDSYTAAPYVYLTAVAGGCLRSDGNYPALLAKRLRIEHLVDVSCSAASTANLTQPQRTLNQIQPPQLAAVRADTSLVTIGLGGNDFGLFGSLSNGCPITGPDGRTAGVVDPAACGQVNPARAEQDVRGIQRLLTTGLRRIHAKAPHATVVLVGYPRIVSTTVSCPAILPVSLPRARTIDRVSRSLNRAMSAAAKATGTLYVDMYAASQGHDVCGGPSAWVNGVRTDTERAAALHPFALEQQAVADRIATLLQH